MSTGEFKFPGMPSAPSKRDVANAVVTFVTKYKSHKHIFPYEQLTHQQVEEIVDGVRDMIYEYEELRPSDNDNFEDDDGATTV